MARFWWPEVRTSGETRGKFRWNSGGIMNCEFFSDPRAWGFAVVEEIFDFD
jgi:hypothetical protein